MTKTAKELKCSYYLLVYQPMSCSLRKIIEKTKKMSATAQEEDLITLINYYLVEIIEFERNNDDLNIYRGFEIVTNF